MTEVEEKIQEIRLELASCSKKGCDICEMGLAEVERLSGMLPRVKEHGYSAVLLAELKEELCTTAKNVNMKR